MGQEEAQEIRLTQGRRDPTQQSRGLCPCLIKEHCGSCWGQRSHPPTSCPPQDDSGHFSSQRDPTRPLTVCTVHHKKWRLVVC